MQIKVYLSYAMNLYDNMELCRESIGHIDQMQYFNYWIAVVFGTQIS